MARTQSSRLNFLGVIALLIGIAAFVAIKMPIAGYGPIPIALLGLGVGALAFLVSIMLKWGSGVPVLAVLLSAGAIVMVEYNNGTLPDWWAKMHPASKPAPVPAVVAPVPPPTVSGPASTDDRPHSIFDTDIRGSGGSGTPRATTTTPPVNLPPAAPAVIAPTPAIPVAPQPTAPSVAEARAKLNAANEAVERSLASDPAYLQARAEVAAADEKRKTALADGGPGSPQVLEAGSQWLDAKSKLKKLVDAAAAKDPAAQAAQKEMNDAEAGVRAGKLGGGK